MTAKNVWFPSLIAAAVLHACWASEASAQYQASGLNPGQSLNNYILNRPTLSPYLNLARNDIGGSSGLPNYYTFVKPELDRRQDAAVQQSQIRQLQNQVSGVQANLQQAQQRGRAAVSGHPTRFMSYSHYYPLMPQRR